MNRDQLLAEMERILSAAQAESRDLSAEEQAQYDALSAKVAAMDALTRRRQEVVSLRQAAPRVAPVVAETTTTETPANTAGAAPIRAPGAEATREFSSLAEFCQAAVFDPQDPRLHFVSGADTNIPNRRGEQRMDQGSTGGFLIPQQFRTEIYAVEGSGAIVRPRATVIPAGNPPDSAITLNALDQSGAAPSNVFGGVEVRWLGEGGAKPETSATFRQVELQPQEQAGYITLTDKFLRNAPAAGAYIANLLPRALAQSEDRAFIRGDGIGKPRGYINSPGAYAAARTTGGTVKYADLIEMVSRLLTLGGSPVWVITRRLLPIIAQIQDNSGASDGHGQYIFNAQLQTLLGYPVIWSERSPAVGALGDVSLVDLSAYLIKDGSGPFIAYSEHVNFLSNKTVVKAFSNVDGQSWLTEPFTGEDGTDTSPFVLLAA